MGLLGRRWQGARGRQVPNGTAPLAEAQDAHDVDLDAPDGAARSAAPDLLAPMDLVADGAGGGGEPGGWLRHHRRRLWRRGVADPGAGRGRGRSRRRRLHHLEHGETAAAAGAGAGATATRGDALVRRRPTTCPADQGRRGRADLPGADADAGARCRGPRRGRSGGPGCRGGRARHRARHAGPGARGRRRRGGGPGGRRPAASPTVGVLRRR